MDKKPEISVELFGEPITLLLNGDHYLSADRQLKLKTGEKGCQAVAQIGSLKIPGEAKHPKVAVRRIEQNAQVAFEELAGRLGYELRG